MWSAESFSEGDISSLLQARISRSAKPAYMGMNLRCCVAALWHGASPLSRARDPLR